VAAVVPGGAEIGRDPEDAVGGARPRDDHVDEPVVAVEVDLHLAVRVQVVLPAPGLDAVLEHPAAPDREVDRILAVVGGAVVPDLLHRGVLLGEDRPLPRNGVEARGARGRRRPDVVVLDRDPVDDVVHEAAVHLVPVVEPAAGQAGEPPAEEAEPDVAGLGVDVDRGDDLERQAVLLLPRLHDLARGLVDQGEPVLGAHPHPRAVHLDREDVVVRQAVRDRELLPVRVDVRKLRRPRLHRRSGLHRRPGWRRIARGETRGGDRRHQNRQEGLVPLHPLFPRRHSVFRYSMRSLSWSFVMSFV
jgi:hypothetical protein